MPKARSRQIRCASCSDVCTKTAGVKGATSHSGRRTFITKLASKGVSAKALMTLAGHKHLSTTQRYIEVNDAMLRAAVDLL
jgi:integrase/recombinase XerD